MHDMTIDEFNAYAAVVVPYIQANKVRLQITDDEFVALNVLWVATTPANTPMNWQDTYALHADPNN